MSTIRDTTITKDREAEARGKGSEGCDKTQSGGSSRAVLMTTTTTNGNCSTPPTPPTSTLPTLDLVEAENVNYLPHRHTSASAVSAEDGASSLESTGTVLDKTNMTTPSSKILLIEYLSEHAMLKSFVAGSVSASCSTFLFQPFDLLKTRIQTAQLITASAQHAHHGSTRMMPIIVDVVKNQQLLGLWRGTGPSLLRTVPGVGLHFCCLDTLQSHFCAHQRQPTAMQALAFGMSSRTIAGVLLIPVTVVKTRYESGVFAYRSLVEAIRDIYRHEGARGLTSGLAATLMRDVPFSGIYFMFYTQLKKLLLNDEQKPRNKNAFTSSNSFLTFACGVQAGLLASVVTQPMDVVKTHMQLEPKLNATFSSTVIQIVKHQGSSGLFAGMLPRLMRRTLMASMAWTVYEQMMTGFGLK